MMLSMEMTHILHRVRDLIVKLEDYIKDNPDLNQHIIFQSQNIVLVLRILFYGANDVLEQLKSEELLSRSLMTQYKLIRYYLITGQSKVALDLCEEVVSNYSSPELDIQLAECQWVSGNLDLASNSLWKILNNRSNYQPLNIIRAHEILYRIYLRSHNYKGIIELLNFSKKWLPGEYAKCGHDPELAKKRLDERFMRFTELL